MVIEWSSSGQGVRGSSRVRRVAVTAVEVRAVEVRAVEVRVVEVV